MAGPTRSVIKDYRALGEDARGGNESDCCQD
jgi:hypothetical protein